ncbi:hypothetical protein JF544_05645 [Halobacillus kuroshimensis]|uniref:Uncharacterized protein n=1 Tax=Halobacillus kuroshimensis TaxID=302481 RepID=A0ABS3DTR5_9BACI|nr:hypothetical protein [Halobacillus kuroshimensis]MBN8234721.1 hypothetical protein [Halobacillus kuroshimensis]
MDELLQQYADMFKVNFPIFSVVGMDEAEIKRLIEKAIDSNEHYEAVYEEKGDY